jgi:glycine dehydrogenase
MTSPVPFWRFASAPFKRRAVAISAHINPSTTCRRCYSIHRRLRAEFERNVKLWYQDPLDRFPNRHIGPSGEDTSKMLRQLEPSVTDLEDFINQTIPASIRSPKKLDLYHNVSLSKARFGKLEETEGHTIEWFRQLAKDIKVFKSYIGCGYYGTQLPEVIKRNVLESPAWYTSYTPYQAEISQGRLESLLNFQTVATELTGLGIANASVLDESTAAAEAMTLSMNALPTSRQNAPGKTFVVSHLCHPQTIAVLESRATGFGINICVGDILQDDCKLVKEQGDNLIGVLAQYPDTEGGAFDFKALASVVHDLGSIFSVATDLLALTVLTPPGEFGADIAFGSAQRFGVPMGYGGPHAAFFACAEKFKRKIPGRLVGVSKDRLGNRALRLALQTREQHIRREKATSNICTAQALLANMSAFYAIYHGPHGLKAIAEKVRSMTRFVQSHLVQHGFRISTKGVRDDGAVLFDTFVVEMDESQTQEILRRALELGINLRPISNTRIGVSLDETCSRSELTDILNAFGVDHDNISSDKLNGSGSVNVDDDSLPSGLVRKTPFLSQAVFNEHYSETELLRYIHHLQSKDLSLIHSMIPLGSCTMKLNATTEMAPITWPEFSLLHPFAPLNQTTGYLTLIRTLERFLINITGMDAISLQPNSGAQGEFAGLRVIKKYQDSKSSGKTRNICLIPVSAHGTNPASAAMAGMKVVPLRCDAKTGNLDIQDLKEKCKKHRDELAAIMVTYPSTFGVFEPEIKEVCNIVHEHGGQVYMDGANLNAQMGLTNPGFIGADVCHLNLHKTFCIPHGGGGPGVGPIAVKAHLKKHLPSHPFVDPLEKDDKQENLNRAQNAISPVSAAPWGSASILPISAAYIRMMGGAGLTHATKVTLLNANYIMSRLIPYYPILYTNSSGRCAHEFILDARKFKESCGIEAIDIAKRLQDYGFHAPTMSWPVANTLMIEPTESESKEELDRFCDALIEIRKEIKAVEDGKVPREGNVLKMAPHTQGDLLRDDWDRSYTRQQAAYPLPWLREKKFWPSVTRVDDGTYNPRNRGIDRLTRDPSLW